MGSRQGIPTIDPAFADMPTLPNAACTGHERPEIWFADEAELEGRRDRLGIIHRETSTERRWRLRDAEQAKAICRDCPALALCEQYTVTHRKQTAWGIWAGKSRRQRGHKGK